MPSRLLITLLLFLLLLFPRLAGAQVIINRKGEENPAVVVTKSIVWGGLGGLVLGGAIALAAGENEGGIIKWSFVGGTGFGLVLGLWHVTHRPEPVAGLLDVTPDGAEVGVPAVALTTRPDPLLAIERVDRTAYVPLVSLHR